MKSYIFSLGNSSSLNNNSSNSNYTNSLIDKALGLTPYWNKKGNSQSYLNGFPFTLENKRSPLFSSNYSKIQNDLDIYDMWTSAMNKLKAYSTTNNQSYEALVNGIPANFFGDFAQIGNIIVPTYGSRNYFQNLPSSTKTTIMNISVTINNYMIA